ncbi:MAG: carbon-nitrogen hydrolase family protein [Deltaproteobacteria bacterium]|nr:carbon-nitrogen hydrolase family protein [Deltaproteobacteria bacterium]MBW2071134.1 carbon-nitrogen hydrolase family protein [Deltaproteobacteria bacterium]
MKETVRVAIVQAKPYPELADPRNIGHAIRLLEKCYGREVDVACLPEYFPWSGDEVVAEMAKKLGCYIVAGLIEVVGNQWYNTATLFDRHGNLVGRQRKYNLGRLERDRMGLTPGSGDYPVFKTDFGRLGIPVCLDFWGQPEAARLLTDRGADLIINQAIFPLLRGHWKYGALVRAFDNFIPVVGINTADFNSRIGGRVYRQHGGHSFIVQPPKLVTKDDFRIWFRSLDNLESWVTVELDRREQLSIEEVNLGTARKFRGEFWRQLGIHRRPFE